MFATTGFTSYQWYLNGVAIPGAITASYLTTANGLYEVTATDSNGCSETSLPVNITTSLAEIRGENTLIYPNPAEDFIVVHPADENSELKFFDPTGRQMCNFKLLPGVASKLDIGTLPAGIYFVVRQSASGKTQVQKVVKY